MTFEASSDNKTRVFRHHLNGPEQSTQGRKVAEMPIKYDAKLTASVQAPMRVSKHPVRRPSLDRMPPVKRRITKDQVITVRCTTRETIIGDESRPTLRKSIRNPIFLGHPGRGEGIIDEINAARAHLRSISES